MTIPPLDTAVIFLGENFATTEELRAELVRRVREHPDRRTAREHVDIWNRRFTGRGRPARPITEAELKERP